MLLVVDIGNTNIVFGVFDGDELVASFRLHTSLSRTIDEYAALLRPFFAEKLSSKKVTACVLSSVVPPLTQDIVEFLGERFSLDVLQVGPGVKTGLPLRVKDPAGVGSDRVVNAVAAKHIVGSPALVVDFGTATSLDVVNDQGAYIGGMILPGVQVSIDALVEHTAKLPKIQLSWPETVIGNDTVSAMQSGTVLGYHCMIDGLIDSIEQETGFVPSVLCTGGLGRLFSQHSAKLQHYEPQLTLLGLRLISEMNS